MRKLLLSMALVVLAGDPAALCPGRGLVGPEEFGPTNDPTNDPGAGRPSPAARQRCADEKNLSDPNDPLSKENAALDKKIKSICRGC